MSFLTELKRRNVIRAGLLYIGTVWALAQGIASLAPAFGAPDWITRWFVIAGAVGFPFWLAFAWFYELTPEGLKRESEIDPGDSTAHRTNRKVDRWIIAVMAVAIVLLLTDRFVLRSGASRAAEVPEHSIAVLPFVNRSPDKDQDYFSDGISEDMLNLLAKVRELKVISRSSSFSFKGKNVPLKEIAQALGVAYILEGAVQRAGDTLRVSAQLVDARTDHSVWSESYDRPFDDVFAVQDEIAGAVVGQLKLKLLGTAQAIDAEAYALFLRGRQQARKSSREGYEEALVLFQEVLATAPGYAPAWDQLAKVYINQVVFGLRPVDEGVRLAREALVTALAADPDYVSANASLGWWEMRFGGDLSAAARRFERALSLQPPDAPLLTNAAGFAASLGRLDLAIELNKAANALDPVSVIGHFNLGAKYLAARRSDEAIASFRAALRLSPGFVNGQAALGLALLQKGDAEAALAEAEKETQEDERLSALAIIHHALGRSADSDAALAELIAKHGNAAPYDIAYVLAYRGEVDRSFEWLDTAQAQHDPGLPEIMVEPLFENLFQDPRWLPLLRKLGKDPETLGKVAFEVALPK